MPRPVGRTRFHCKENMNDSVVIATLFDNFVYSLFFAEIIFSNEINL